MLTQRTAHGVSAMLVANVLGRVAGLAAQIITGFALLDTEFGVFAMAIGITTVAGLLRGGEIQNYLVSLPPARRRFRTGSAFWLAEIFTLAGVIPTLLLAPTLGSWLEQPGIVPLLWILSATMLLAPVRFVLYARLNAELRFSSVAKSTLINTLVQYPLIIILALTLGNALALCIPVLIGVVVELVYLLMKVRPVRSDFLPSWRLMPGVLYRIRWLVAVAAMTSLWTSGDYLVAEFFVPANILGVYYFGYQLAVQPGRLFMITVTNIIIPVVRRVGEDSARLRSVTKRLIGTGGFAIASVNIAMLAGIAPLEALIWKGKWDDSVFAVQVLSIGLTYTAILGMATSILMAERRYLESLASNAVRALAVMVGAGIGAIIWADVDGIATTVSISMGVAGIGTTAWLGTRYGVPLLSTIPHLLRCTLPVMVAGVLSAWLGEWMLDRIDWGRGSAILAGITSGGLYGALLLVGLRILPQQTRTEILSLVPARLRPILRFFAGQREATQDS